MATWHIRRPRGACRSLLVWFIVLPLSILGLVHLLASSPLDLLRTTLSPTTASSPSSSSPKPAMAAAFLDAVRSRRSLYELDKKLPIGQDLIKWIVNESIQAVPSAFNSQSNRAVVLFGAEHDRLWDLIGDVLKARISPEKWVEASEGMDGFKAAAGTVLFFVDESVINRFQENIPSYAQNFPTWATQSDGMLQHTVWTALEAEGLGASLQHYNPIIDDKVADAWDLPDTWRLSSQLVFGGRVGGPENKESGPLSDKIRFFGA
ncbi:hypothetical protein RB601_004790 [Gaeumannomyces tritici]